MPTRCNWGLCVRFAGSPQTGHTTLNSTPYRQLENQAPKTTCGNQLYNTLELLMMGIIVSEICWAYNKICNKKHLLLLVGILFPHNIDDARSKSHQIQIIIISLNRIRRWLFIMEMHCVVCEVVIESFDLICISHRFWRVHCRSACI
jgi:hypothetical protein